jgi:hypothetical protein
MQTVRFTLRPEQFSLITDSGQRIVEPGTFEIAVGGHQPGADDAGVLVRQIEMVGDPLVLPR